MAEKSTHEKLVAAGKKGAEARWGEGREISEETREKLSEAGKKGGEAPHECRGRECTHPSHRR